MARTQLKRKANTTMVVNPNRGLSIGGGRGRSTVRKAPSRSNPVKRHAAPVANPRKRSRRRRNPASFSILTNPSGSALIGAALAGVGLSLVDYGLNRVVPSASPVIQVASKVAAGFLIQSFGSKIPILGKYKDGIAFLLFGIAAAQAANIWLLPTARSLVGQVTGGLQSVLVPAPAATAPAQELGNVWGQRRYYA